MLSVALAAAACERPPPTSSPTAVAHDRSLSARVETPVEPPAPSPAGRAMVTVFGEERGGVLKVGGAEFDYADGRLVRRGKFLALVARGQRQSAAHPDGGVIGVWYLAETTGHLTVVGAFPATARGGSFGDAPEWHLRHDLGPDPVIQADGFGQWFGHAFGCTQLVALAPRRPVVIARGILTHYSYNPGDAPIDSEPREDITGVIAHDARRDRLVVTYRGTTSARVTYRRVGQGYRAPRLRKELRRC